MIETADIPSTLKHRLLLAKGQDSSCLLCFCCHNPSLALGNFLIGFVSNTFLQSYCWEEKDLKAQRLLTNV